MPLAAHASKWVLVVTVPPVRLFCLTLQYCWNVLVPSILGALVRVDCAMVYVPPSEVTEPFEVAPEDGLSDIHQLSSLKEKGSW